MRLSSAGIAAAIGASCIWGVSPVYFHALSHFAPIDVLSHRIVWGCVFTGLFCLATGRGPAIAVALGTRRQVAGLALSACLISVNWFTFLWAVQAGRVTESGLGYYLMPILSVGLGVALLGERLDRRQWAAVGMAALAVAVLAAGTGSAPVVPLILAGSFACYGLVRKRLGVGAITGFQIEVMLLAPLALGWILLGPRGAVTAGSEGWLGAGTGSLWLLLLAGPLTGLPLILFAEAARRLPYSTVGVIQYVNPTLQVLVAVMVLGEAVTPWHVAALGLIWIGLALYTASLIDQERAARRTPIASAGDATTVR